MQKHKSIKEIEKLLEKVSRKQFGKPSKIKRIINTLKR